MPVPETTKEVDEYERVAASDLEQADIMTMLNATSRTFSIPIGRLPDGIRQAITSAYLCMRAIDEIEDHPTLDNVAKTNLLQQVSHIFQAHHYDNQSSIGSMFSDTFESYKVSLHPVTLRIGEWAEHAPRELRPSIWNATASMADRMAFWTRANWRIETQADLDAYTYSVAGAIGLLICETMSWYDGTQMSRHAAIHFGRGLQVTNIARNRLDDLTRGVDFYPRGWNDADVRQYATHWLRLTSDYAQSLPEAPFSYFIKIPLALAEGTLEALARGDTKLSRSEVAHIIGQLS